ncbi:MAG: DnaJ domain-containing protein [Planctomycetota bacterium]
MLRGQIEYDPCNDYYEALSVASQASPADILRAYRRAVKKHHPDAGGDSAGRAIRAVYEAYAVLGDRYKRSHYNWSRNRYGRPASRPRTPARAAEKPLLRQWMRRAAAVTFSVIAGALLLVAAATGLRPYRMQGPPRTRNDGAPAGGVTAQAGSRTPRAAAFEYATPLESEDAAAN